MKFGDHLNESMIPEWKDKYVEYKVGKKKLKTFKQKLQNDIDETTTDSLLNASVSDSIESTYIDQENSTPVTPSHVYSCLLYTSRCV